MNVVCVMSDPRGTFVGKTTRSNETVLGATIHVSKSGIFCCAEVTAHRRREYSLGGIGSVVLALTHRLIWTE